MHDTILTGVQVILSRDDITISKYDFGSRQTNIEEANLQDENSYEGMGKTNHF